MTTNSKKKINEFHLQKFILQINSLEITKRLLNVALTWLFQKTFFLWWTNFTTRFLGKIKDRPILKTILWFSKNRLNNISRVVLFLQGQVTGPYISRFHLFDAKQGTTSERYSLSHRSRGEARTNPCVQDTHYDDDVRYHCRSRTARNISN